MKVHGDLKRTSCPICASEALAPLWNIPFAAIDPPVLINGAYTRTAPILDAEAKTFAYVLCGD